MNEPIMLFRDENGRYYPSVCCGRKLVTPTEIETVIKDLKYYCNHHTDREIEIGNDLAMQETFGR